jgi:hypothetical protein
MMKRKDRPIFLLSAVIYGMGLYFFYIKYVPLVKNFQIALIAVLFTVFILSAFRAEWGILFFIFSFPLINNLPYFFGIPESIPHAPTALVLFLSFFLGWLLHNVFHKGDFLLSSKIFKPISLISILIVVSAVINFLRFSNFFPFLGDHVYELTTNVIGVTSGGAIMSAIFFGFSYLTGFAFFFVLISGVRSNRFLKKIVITFCLGVFISLCFGLYQNLIDMKLGNNPRIISGGFINATFKDALSCGAFISIAAPLILGVFFYSNWKGKIFTSIMFVLASYLIFFSGSKSGLIALVISLFIFLILAIGRALSLMKARKISLKKALSFSAAFFLIVVAIALSLKTFKIDFKKAVTYRRLNVFIKQSLSDYPPFSRTSHWKNALYMIRDYPMTGVGMGGYIIEAPNYSLEYKTKIVVSESAENYFLQVTSELGFVGLFIVLWIFWEIAKEVRRSYKRIPDNDRHKFILMGAIAGIISYFINIQAHTYIGSYEIKYAFWLLVGIIFCMGKITQDESAGGEEKAPGQKLRWRKSLKISSVALIVLFGVVHLWNSTHSLSLKSRTERLGIKQDFGFYQQEKTKEGRDFRWTRGYGGLTVQIEKPVMSIPILASHPDIHYNPVKVKIYLVKEFFKKKKLLQEITITRSIWQTHEFYVPKEVGQEVILLFKVSRTWNPLKWRGTPDPRNLGIAIGEIEFMDRPAL